MPKKSEKYFNEKLLFMEAGFDLYIQNWSEEPSLYKLFGY